MARMRIGYVAYYDLRNQTAAREHIIQVVNGFARKGNEVHLYVPNAEVDSLEKGVTVHPVSGSLSALFDRNCPRQLEKPGKFDVLYVRDYVLARSPIEWARTRGIPVILEHNGLYFVEMKHLKLPSRILFALDSLNRFPARLRTATVNLTVTRSIGEFLGKKYGLPAERFIFVPNGVDTSRFTPAEDKPKLRRQLGIPGNGVLVGYIGSMQPWHHLENLVEGFERVADQFPETRLLIGGGGIDAENVRRAIGRSRVKGKILWKSPLSVSESAKYISALDIGIALMDPEVAPYCWQVKVNHYAASGVVSVITYADEFAELIESGVAVGVNFPSPAEIAGAIKSLIEGKKYEILGGRARDYAVKNLSWDKIVDKILRIIENIAKRRQ